MVNGTPGIGASKKKSQIKGKKQQTKGDEAFSAETVSEKEREREKRGLEREKLLSKIYRIWIISFCLSKRQSQFTHRELRLGTKIF